MSVSVCPTGAFRTSGSEFVQKSAMNIYTRRPERQLKRAAPALGTHSTQNLLKNLLDCLSVSYSRDIPHLLNVQIKIAFGGNG